MINTPDKRERWQPSSFIAVRSTKRTHHYLDDEWGGIDSRLHISDQVMIAQSLLHLLLFSKYCVYLAILRNTLMRFLLIFHQTTPLASNYPDTFKFESRSPWLGSLQEKGLLCGARVEWSQVQVKTSWTDDLLDGDGKLSKKMVMKSRVQYYRVDCEILKKSNANLNWTYFISKFGN
jgi:hypothetical protein